MRPLSVLRMLYAVDRGMSLASGPRQAVTQGIRYTETHYVVFKPGRNSKVTCTRLF